MQEDKCMCVVYFNNMYQINRAKTFINSFPTIHNKCCLLFHQLAYFDSLYCKQYGPKSDFSLRISLIRLTVYASMIKAFLSVFEYLEQML